jgi:cytochrome c-type biogenesis protein CcmH
MSRKTRLMRSADGLHRRITAMVSAGLLSLPILAGARPYADGELALEQRLMAPCCWVQTLDIHDSPIAKELRTEIHARLFRGESSASIEADMVARYGPRMVAMPASNPLAKIAAIVAAAVVVAGLFVFYALRRWRRRQALDEQSAVASQATGRDEWDDRLDEELREP